MERRLIVAAGVQDREICPVRAVVPEARPDMPARLFEAESGREVACQAGAGAIHWIIDRLPRGQVRAYRLLVGASSNDADSNDSSAVDPPASEFGMLVGSDGSLDFIVGGSLFTSYHYGDNWARPFFHPLVGPGGKRVARSWPIEEPPEDAAVESRDHKHHKGLWVAQGDVNGVDDWSEEPGHGKQLHRGFSELSSGAVFAGAVEELDWVSATDELLLAETRRLTVYNLPGESRLLDLEVRLAATTGPVKLGDTKEAGLVAVRVASTMEGTRGGLIENGFGGKREAATWGKVAPWCHYSGLVGGEHLGIGLFDYPTNPRYPTNWHVRDYGLMTANSFGLHDFFPGTERDGSLSIAAGESLTFRYRVYVHRGDAATGNTEERFGDFAAPPAVGVE